MPQPVLGDHIGISDGWSLGQEFLILQLLQHYNATKNALFNVVDDVDGFPHSEHDLYMPDITCWKWHGGPSPQEVSSGEGALTGFVGPVDDTERASSNYILAEAKSGYVANLPFGIALVFEESSNKKVRCPVEVAVLGEENARFLEKREILTRRATHYLGALLHTLHERCGQAPVCRRFVVTSDYTLAGALRIVDVEGAQNTTRSVAIIVVEGFIEQFQYTPKIISP